MPLNCRSDGAELDISKTKKMSGVGILSRGRETGNISATSVGERLFRGYVSGSMGQLRSLLDEE